MKHEEEKDVSGFTTRIADAPYLSEPEEEEDDDNAKPKAWWKPEQYKKYFMVVDHHDPNNPYTAFYLKCLPAWVGCNDLLSPTSFLDILLKIDPKATFDHKAKKVTSQKMARALNASLFQQFKFSDFPKIVKITRASKFDPLWIYIDLQFPGPDGQLYTFCKMKTLFWLIDQFRHENDDLDELLDDYIAKQQK